MVDIDIGAIRARIKDNLSTLSGFQVYDHEPKTKRFPCATVSWPDTLDPRATLTGDVDLTIPVLVEVAWLGDESSDQTLMEAMNEVVGKIESDRDLNGLCDDLSCGAFTNIGSRQTLDEKTVMQFVVPVEILA